MRPNDPASPPRRPFTAAAATTITIVVIAVVAVLIPWSHLTGNHTAQTNDSTATGPGPEDRNSGTLHYVALGSSYAAGPDSEGLISRRCMRTRDDYPHQVAAALRLRLTDVTCSGSVIRDIVRRAQPGHASAPQIDAVTADTSLVTITTGGNDIQYIGRLTAISCANHLAVSATKGVGVRCHDEPPRKPPAAKDYTTLTRDLVRLVEEVRIRAPHAVVVIVNYVPVLDSSAATCASVPLSASQAASTVTTFDGLTAATKSAAVSTDSIFVDAATPGAEHTACSSSPWVYGYRLPAPYHPNALGRRAMAELTIAAVSKIDLTRSALAN